MTRLWGCRAFPSGSHYLHDLLKNRVELYGNLSLRVVAGLSLTLMGNYSFVHDQLALRELATGYSFWVFVGITSTFGSAFSNIVSPIF